MFEIHVVFQRMKQGARQNIPRKIAAYDKYKKRQFGDVDGTKIHNIVQHGIYI